MFLACEAISNARLGLKPSPITPTIMLVNRPLTPWVAAPCINTGLLMPKEALMPPERPLSCHF